MPTALLEPAPILRRVELAMRKPIKHIGRADVQSLKAIAELVESAALIREGNILLEARATPQGQIPIDMVRAYHSKVEKAWKQREKEIDEQADLAAAEHPDPAEEIEKPDELNQHTIDELARHGAPAMAIERLKGGGFLTIAEMASDPTGWRSVRYIGQVLADQIQSALDSWTEHHSAKEAVSDGSPTEAEMENAL